MGSFVSNRVPEYLCFFQSWTPSFFISYSSIMSVFTVRLLSASMFSMLLPTSSIQCLQFDPSQQISSAYCGGLMVSVLSAFCCNSGLGGVMLDHDGSLLCGLWCCLQRESVNKNLNKMRERPSTCGTPKFEVNSFLDIFLTLTARLTSSIRSFMRCSSSSSSMVFRPLSFSLSWRSQRPCSYPYFHVINHCESFFLALFCISSELWCEGDKFPCSTTL